MSVGVKELIEVRISKRISIDIAKGLRGRGLPQTMEVKVGTFMKVRLQGDNFAIKKIGDEDQFVDREEFTQWEWDILPLKSGIQSLKLGVAVRIKIPHSKDEAKFTVFERDIEVKTNYNWSIKNFIEKNWDYLFEKVLL